MAPRVRAVLTDDGRTLWTAVSGTGAPLVLCHGGPGLWDMFEGLAGSLADLRTVWRWDQRGCGRSSAGGPYTFDRSVADLDSVVAAAGGRVGLLGHSWGAQLALRYALDHPGRVSRLVYLSGTGLSVDAWRPAFHAAFVRRLGRAAAILRELEAAGCDREAAVLRWSADVVDPLRAREIAESMATPWFGVNMQANRGIVDDVAAHWDESAVEAACRVLAVPTLILEGAEDIRPRWAVDPLAAALPQVTRVTLPGVGHLPWLEAAEATLGPLRSFLAVP
jgi:proline iminopeptidase